MDLGKKDNETYELTAEEQEKYDRAKAAAKSGCVQFFMTAGTHLFNAMLLMFTVALLGHPLGYLVCLLIAYTASSIIGVSTAGETMLLAKIYKRLGGEE